MRILRSELPALKRKTKAINKADSLLWQIEPNSKKHNALMEQYKTIITFGGTRKANLWLKKLGGKRNI